MKNFKDLNIKSNIKVFVGEKISINTILNKEIIIHKFKIKDSKYKGEYLNIQIEMDGKKKVVFTGSSVLIDMIKQIKESDFPIKTTIISSNNYYEFS